MGWGEIMVWMVGLEGCKEGGRMREKVRYGLVMYVEDGKGVDVV